MRRVKAIAIGKPGTKLPRPGIHLFFPLGAKLTHQQTAILAIHQHTLIFQGSGKASGRSMRFLSAELSSQNLDALTFPKSQSARLR